VLGRLSLPEIESECGFLFKEVREIVFGGVGRQLSVSATYLALFFGVGFGDGASRGSVVGRPYEEKDFKSAVKSTYFVLVKP